MGLFNSSAARLARSVVDWRLSGLPVRATTSQAMETPMALSRGGKGRLPAAPRGIVEGKLPLSPALPPAADTVRVKVELSGDLDVGSRRAFVQEQYQESPLPEVRCCSACGGESSGLGEELIGEARPIAWRWSRHGTALL